jgi:hypothetical protein
LRLEVNGQLTGVKTRVVFSGFSDTPAVYSPLSDGNALAAQPPGLLLPAVRRQFPVCPNHPPPGEAQTGGKDVSHRPSCSRITGSAGDFAVTDDLTAPHVANDGPHRLDKRSLLRHARR